MKKGLLSLTCLATLTVAGQNACAQKEADAILPDGEHPVKGSLTFANEDKISGTPEGIDEDGNLRWSAAFLHQAIPVKPSSIVEMRLEGGSESTTTMYYCCCFFALPHKKNLPCPQEV